MPRLGRCKQSRSRNGHRPRDRRRIHLQRFRYSVTQEGFVSIDYPIGGNYAVDYVENDQSPIDRKVGSQQLAEMLGGPASPKRGDGRAHDFLDFVEAKIEEPFEALLDHVRLVDIDIVVAACKLQEDYSQREL